MTRDELMMYDWIYIKTLEGTDLLGQVTGVSSDQVEVETPKPFGFIYSDSYSAVPLSNEILKLNGFEEKCCDGVQGMFNSQLRLFIKSDTRLGCFEICLSEENEENIICLRDVHSLQNFLRCVGYKEFANNFCVK